jgi:extracellular factor (EF) 3-hydroxypalmitic acid methyl ester biosynthesis protein
MSPPARAIAPSPPSLPDNLAPAPAAPATPKSDPPPPSGRRPISSRPPRHQDLDGAGGTAVRFRPARLAAADIPVDLTCRFRTDGILVGPLALLDLSGVGFAAAVPPDLLLAPGSVLDSFELLVGEHPIWTGEAILVRGSADCVGGRFTSGIVDLKHLRLGATLDGRVAIHRECRKHLPAEWRAAVGDIVQLLQGARREIDELERLEEDNASRGDLGKSKVFEGFRDRWGTAFYEAVCELFEMSRSFDEHTANLGRAYASSMILPFTVASPFHRRAHEKPLGYAGDYRMMELCFSEPAGDGLFGGFIDAVIKRSTLVRAVVEREAVMREAVRTVVEREGDSPIRVLAVAAGPAMELRRFLTEVRALRRPVELILLDQDRSAHESAHRDLTRILLEQHFGTLPVTVRCLHFSVRQLLRPQTPEDERVVQETLADLDLVYSAGLYDYLPDPVATALTNLLYGRLRAGGQLLVGNLVETPDSTWVLDYVLDWRLIYRTEETMLRLAKDLAPAPAALNVVPDKTGRCLFLAATRPTST